MKYLVLLNLEQCISVAIDLTSINPFFRYGLFDFEYMHQCQGTSESSKKQKLFLMSWCPDTAKVSSLHIALH